jgi:Flp pilus assembly pilin Flp
MKVTHDQLRTLRFDDAGQDVIEYALLGALIALAVFAAMPNFGMKLSRGYTRIGRKL